MKTFKDLTFKPHRVPDMFGTQAELFFENGYGVSVITGKHAYSSASLPYEVAILKGNSESSFICYNTPITDDVIGYNTSEDVTEIMLRVQKLTDQTSAP